MNNYFVGLSGDTVINAPLNSTISGLGKFYNDDLSYNGTIINGMMTDENGLIIYYKTDYNMTDESTNYKNDYKKYEGSIKENKFDGFGKLTYTNGNVFIGNFTNGLKNGKGKMYNSIGDITMDETWINDKINGFVVCNEYYPNKKLKLSGKYFNDIKVGSWIYYNELGNITLIELYDDNIELETSKLVGTLECLDNGMFKKQILTDLDLTLYKLIMGEYTYSNINIMIGECKKYFDTHNNFDSQTIKLLKEIAIPTDTKDYTSRYILCDNFEINKYSNGIEKEYLQKKDINQYIIRGENDNIIYTYDKNHKKPSMYYSGSLNKFNQLHGDGILYEQETVKYNGTFDKGNLIIGSHFDINKNLIYTGTYKNFYYDGIGTLYNKNKVKTYEGEFRNSLRHGTGISYWENTGHINWDGKWFNGLKHGSGSLYDDTGALICICQHENDVMTFVD
jgi:antitoxin component YwqK of YwqJK toxin-antitoxin module